MVSVGPFAGNRTPLGTPGRPPTSWRRVSGHYPALHYYEPSDSSEGVGLPFPAGYSVAYPISSDPSTGPHLDHRSPDPSGTTSLCEDCTGPYEVSLDHLINTVAAARRNHRLAPSPSPVVPAEERSLASLFAGKSPQPDGLLSVHYSFEPAALPPPPPHPSSPRRTGHRLLNFNDQSSGRTRTSLLMKLPAVPRNDPAWRRQGRTRAASGMGWLPHRGLLCPVGGLGGSNVRHKVKEINVKHVLFVCILKRRSREEPRNCNAVPRFIARLPCAPSSYTGSGLPAYVMTGDARSLAKMYSPTVGEIDEFRSFGGDGGACDQPDNRALALWRARGSC